MDISLNFGEEFFASLKNLFQDAVRRKYKNKSSEVELECRVGIPGKLIKKDDYITWTFDPYVEQAIFSSVKSKLDGNSLYKVEYTETDIEIKDVGVGPESKTIRKITQNKNNELSIIYQYKKSVDNVDTLFLSVPLTLPYVNHERNVYMLRLSLSEEENDNIVIKNEYENSTSSIFRRSRKRWSYKALDHIVDLTIIDNIYYSIEMEYTSNLLLSLDIDKLNDLKYLFTNKFFPPLKSLIKTLFPDLTLVYGLNYVNKSYSDLINVSTGGARLSEVRPRNIKESEVGSLLSGYSWTNKLNGTKYRLMIDSYKYMRDTVYLAFVVSDTDIKFVCIDDKSQILQNFNKTLIDVELFEYKNNIELHAFDCLVFQNKKYTTYTHDERISILNTSKLTDQLNKILIKYKYIFEIKKFFYQGPSNIINDFKNTLRYMYNRYGNDIEETNDGLIMTPVGKYEDNYGKIRSKAYYDKSFNIFKWKFPSTVSIDFKIKKIDNFSKNNIKYNVYNLFIRDRNNLIEFSPFKKDKYFNPPSVLVISENDKFYNILEDNMIVELGWNKYENKFIVLRIRTDKTEPNSKITAEDTFVDMEIEFTLDKLEMLLNKALTGKEEQPKQSCLFLFRKFHNSIKNYIIQKFIPKNTQILDLGTGKGGDLDKYEKLNIDFIWMVEPNKEFIEGENGLKQRIKNKNKTFYDKIKIINTKAENTEVILENIKETENQELIKDINIKAVTSFFSISFMFEKEQILDDFIKTIKTTLSNGGIFIGTMMDGQKVYEQLNKNNGILEFCKDERYEEKYYIKRYYNENEPIGFGQQIGINLRETSTVMGEQKEWISSFEILKNKLMDEDIILIETNFINNIANNIPEGAKFYKALKDSEKDLSNLYRYFIFKKQTPPPPPPPTPESLKFINPGELHKIEIYKNTLYNQPLYRVGAIGDGSCFFHSVLTSITPEYYRSLSSNEKEKMVYKFRKYIVRNLKIDTYLSIANGETSILEYQETIRNPLLKIKNIDKKEIDDIITQTIITYQNQRRNNTNLTVLDLQEQIINSFRDKNYDIDLIKKLSQDLIQKNYTNYKKKLEDCSEWVHYELIEYIMLQLKVNIFILKDNLKNKALPFTNCQNYNPNNKSIVILNINDSHFESIWEVFQDQNKNIIANNTFDFNSPLIQALYISICNQ